MESIIRKSLHQEVVEGIVRCCRQLHECITKGESVGFSALMTAARGRGFQNEQASMFVLEFIKDGIGGLGHEDIEKVVSGDYSDIWDATNGFLKNFGHQPIEPCEVQP